eukprot:TRINITY_DN10504_c0_g1_i2.p1 TRINITY_DN10504_c0_g1~~TRINITY_DN10504_c0_g1_i2.p1  ORF type:complete len:171 (+),score=50.45 TRINITY_DN10504_c0_g1_i2:61-573(+)
MEELSEDVVAMVLHTTYGVKPMSRARAKAADLMDSLQKYPDSYMTIDHKDFVLWLAWTEEQIHHLKRKGFIVPGGRFSSLVELYYFTEQYKATGDPAMLEELKEASYYGHVIGTKDLVQWLQETLEGIARKVLTTIDKRPRCSLDDEYGDIVQDNNRKVMEVIRQMAAGG